MANVYNQNQDYFKEIPASGEQGYTASSPLNTEQDRNAKTPFGQSQPTYTGQMQTEVGGPGIGSPYAFTQTEPGPVSTIQPLNMEPQEGEMEATSTFKFWTIEFYQQFFDVDTNMVVKRLAGTAKLGSPPDYLRAHNWTNVLGHMSNSTADDEQGSSVRAKPDLYGPFWICTTLWMLLGIVSNMISKVAFNRHSENNGKVWKYDFTMVSVASIVIYLYCFGVGCTVWGLMRFKNLPITLTDTLCLYGYSLFPFLPVVLLCAIPISFLHWIFVLAGGLWSGAYLCSNLMGVTKALLPQEWFYGISTSVVVFLLLFMASFKFYFLNYAF
ncbi:Yip1 domain [Trypanosoma vivax]|uniref:Protein YIPF n=1 Tax=Trypanosoma vivax (strain Y486) TaxID=1055687 RepID=G0TWG5_TRYVY|nr:Yip1 domain [Trypanosoma vivax]CCC48303.1 conserved hypothetical protein [Trypanosoma vivax Y486]